MTNPKLHERLLELPLFQGMSRGDLDQVIASIRFSSLTFAQDKTVVKEGDACNRLYFLMKGTITATGNADDNGYSITETFTAPEILQPDRIFGLTQRYTRTVRTVTDCNFICIEKLEILQLADRYEIFRLNMLNIICTKSQRLTRIPWRTRPKGIRHKIIRFIETRSLRPAGEKTVRIKMERLAEEIGESRLNVSRELNAMNAEGAISLKRGEIYIHALERLIMQD